MRCRNLLLLAGTLLLATATAQADQPYPKVRTFSGGYYGPTQAHYQYQRRYGRPWHGQGGLSSHSGGHHYGSHHYTNNIGGYGLGGYGLGGYGLGGLSYPSYGYGGLGYGGYGVGYSSSYYRSSLFGPTVIGGGYYPPAVIGSPIVSYPLGVPSYLEPTLQLQSPGVYTPFFSTNPLVNDGLLNNGQLWQQQVPDLVVPQVEPLGEQPLGSETVLPPPTSTPAARLRSLQQQQKGDARLRNLDYLQASLRYQEAIDAAGERVEPHYRLGIAQAGMKRLDKAVAQFKRASELDPSWINSVSLDELLGDDNQIGKTQLKQRVADWALEDAHDADRLYLLGTLLHLDGDVDRARILIDTALALVGNEQHLTAFLTSPATGSVTEPAPGVPPFEPGDPPPPPAPQLPELPEAGSSAESAPEAEARELPEQNPTLPSITPPAGPVFPTTFE